MVEKSLNIHGDEILYVGDHIYTDVSQSKVHLRWRTALICRELEEEVGICSFIMFTISRWKLNFVFQKFSSILCQYFIVMISSLSSLLRMNLIRTIK